MGTRDPGPGTRDPERRPDGGLDFHPPGCTTEGCMGNCSENDPLRRRIASWGVGKWEKGFPIPTPCSLVFSSPGASRTARAARTILEQSISLGGHRGERTEASIVAGAKDVESFRARRGDGDGIAPSPGPSTGARAASRGNWPTWGTTEPSDALGSSNSPEPIGCRGSRRGTVTLAARSSGHTADPAAVEPASSYSSPEGPLGRRVRDR
jgi:hypothetical protein